MFTSISSAQAQKVCRETGTLFICDEVQTGLGRTGEAFGYQRLGWQPDLVSVGKALGGGVPIGACLLSERVATAVSPGSSLNVAVPVATSPELGVALWPSSQTMAPRSKRGSTKCGMATRPASPMGARFTWPAHFCAAAVS